MKGGMKCLALICAVAIVLGGCSRGIVKKWGSGNPEVDKKIESGILADAIYFDSRDSFFKEPFGAVVQGTPVRVRIVTAKDDVKSVKLVLTIQNMVGNATMEQYKALTSEPMKVVNSTNGFDIWECTFKLDKIGVYGYHFELTKSDDDILIYADNVDVAEVPYVNVKGVGGIGKVTPNKKYKLPYTQTVYTNDWKFADWTDNMIIYYIFPDRFKNGNKANDPKVGVSKFYANKDVEFHTNWCDPYPWKPGNEDENTSDDNEYCNDFYGGDLDGIILKLDYLKEMGINLIYINPIFRAPSNHKYDTGDYLTIDPSFGDIRTFVRLVAEAKKRGIYIMLDTSLNHCGSDSVYMDRYSKYPSYGAFEGEQIRKDSAYYDWFEFNEKGTKPDDMYGQWANPTLANLKESESYKDFSFRNTNSVTRYWLKQGIGGWRMDVTPWVSDDYWKEWHKYVKLENPLAFTVAEVWFDASKYLLGDMFDCTMNYIFRGAMINFGKGGSTFGTVAVLEMMRENYPKPVFYRLMNLVSSHDLPRLLYELGYAKYGAKNYETVKPKYLMTLAFQFTYPGAPTIYYGDEIGMTGGNDPFNRGPYPWKEDGGNYGDDSILVFVKALGQMRRTHDVFANGEIRMTYTGTNTIGFERWNEKEYTISLFNNSTKKEMSIPMDGFKAGEYEDAITKETVSVKQDAVMKLTPMSFKILIKK